jgi:hypothetical protein
MSLFSRKVKLPDWMGGGEASLGHVLVLGFFHYHPKILDAWISRHIATAQVRFGHMSTVHEREVHVEVPVELDRKVVPALNPVDLRGTFERRRTCLLVWGEGGAGKTSLACQIAKEPCLKTNPGVHANIACCQS